LSKVFLFVKNHTLYKSGPSLHARLVNMQERSQENNLEKIKGEMNISLGWRGRLSLGWPWQYGTCMVAKIFPRESPPCKWADCARPIGLPSSILGVRVDEQNYAFRFDVCNPAISLSMWTGGAVLSAVGQIFRAARLSLFAGQLSIPFSLIHLVRSGGAQFSLAMENPSGFLQLVVLEAAC
jgi:hypothetical protein